MKRKPSPHVCANRFSGEGARGGCFVTIERSETQKDSCGDPMALLEVGWSCVITVGGMREPCHIPISWLAEVLTIAHDHKGGFAGFLEEHGQGGDPSYALEVDPPKRSMP